VNENDYLDDNYDYFYDNTPTSNLLTIPTGQMPSPIEAQIVIEPKQPEQQLDKQLEQPDSSEQQDQPKNPAEQPVEQPKPQSADQHYPNEEPEHQPAEQQVQKDQELPEQSRQPATRQRWDKHVTGPHFKAGITMILSTPIWLAGATATLAIIIYINTLCFKRKNKTSKHDSGTNITKLFTFDMSHQ
jgi:outer membrane biosynthesis protein TonB